MIVPAAPGAHGRRADRSRAAPAARLSASGRGRQGRLRRRLRQGRV